MELEIMNTEDIVDAINDESLDDNDLVGRESWKIICTVRGRNFNLVDPEAWASLCVRRGYVLSRGNSRGF